MWIHIIIFIVIFGAAAAWKMGWLPMDGIADAKSRKLFFLTAMAGNLLGLALTASSGAGIVHTSGYRLEKEEAGAREECFIVRIDGEEAGTVYVQVPEKETAEEAVQETEPELSKEEQQEQEIREILEQYNQDKNSPDYYYLPSEWEGKHIDWEEPSDNSGGVLAGLTLYKTSAETEQPEDFSCRRRLYRLSSGYGRRRRGILLPGYTVYEGYPWKSGDTAPCGKDEGPGK